jgi:hypothetical protein
MEIQNGLRAKVEADGSFEITNAVPGDYVVALMDSSGPLRVAGWKSITVLRSGQDIVTLSPFPTFELLGDVELTNTGGINLPTQPAANSSSPQMAIGANILLAPIEFPAAALKFPIGPDGSFKLSALSPVKYDLTISGLPDGTYLKSIGLDDRQATASSILDLSEYQGGSGHLAIKLGSAPGTLLGTVTTDQSEPAGDSVITLLPESQSLEQAYLYRRTITDRNGGFTLKNLTPGTYRLYAWDDLEDGAEYDSAFLKPYSPHSARIVIEEGQVSTVTVTRITVQAARGH